MATTYTEHLQIPKHDPTDPFNIALINEMADKTEAGILTAYRGRAAYNLLDNSNFAVNQRGKTSYTGTGYGLDRWRTNFSGDTVEVLAGGVTNTVASTTVGWHLHQIIDNGAELVGKSITAACNAAAITGALYLLISCRNSSDTEIEHASQKIAAGLNVTSLTVPSGTVYIRVGVYAYATSVTVGDNVTLKWVSLYEGEYTAETLPTYMPKGYAAELAECQRYYRNYGMIQFPATITSAGWTSVGIDYTGMRVTPTVQYELAGLYVGNSRITSVSQITARALPASELLVDTGASITAFQVATIRFNSLALSSDL